MKLAAVADVHAGNHRRFGGPVTSSINRRCSATLAVLSNAIDQALAKRCDTFVIAGDLFDYARPEAPIVAEVQRHFMRAQDAGMQVIAMVGNHDQISSAPGDHAMAALQHQALVVEKPMLLERGGADLICIPFHPGHAREWLRDQVSDTVKAVGVARGPSSEGFPRLLAIHLGIKDAKTAPWLSACPDSIDVELLRDICFEHGITHVIAGNWHDRRQWTFTKGAKTLHVLQLGALVPTGWDNPGLIGYGTLGYWAGAKLTFEEIPGPRFVKVQTDDELLDAVNENEDEENELYVSQVAAPEDVPATLARLKSLADNCKVGDFYEVLPDQALAKAEARTAAAKARSSTTLVEALSAFVKRVPMPEHVNRTNVFNRAHAYLK